ncbi:MAG: cytochrome c family protein [Deltaproteobacteria bacterium]|nr:cytochrome c family protein [Deltaproteobacteria bacterium]
MRKYAALLAVVAAVVFSAGLVISAEAPEKITIDHVKKEKAAVVFPHKAHADRIKNCQECHHKNAKGKEEKCFDCHKAKKEGDAPPLKEVVHKKCKGCHQKEKKGPTKCAGCHKA